MSKAIPKSQLWKSIQYEDTCDQPQLRWYIHYPKWLKMIYHGPAFAREKELKEREKESKEHTRKRKKEKLIKREKEKKEKERLT